MKMTILIAVLALANAVLAGAFYEVRPGLSLFSAFASGWCYAIAFVLWDEKK